LHLRLKAKLASGVVDTIHQLDPHVPVMVYSGSASSVDEAKHTIPADWITAYLEKPLAVDRLSDLLDAALTTQEN
jgi:DNA-binding NtrC family response regulator